MSDDPATEARKYLESFFKEKGIKLKQASGVVEMNSAYLQQYIRKGKPVWLPERVRETLVRVYGVDGERLKEPMLKRPVNDFQQEANLNPPSEHKLIDQSRLHELIRIWGKIPRESEDMAMEILKNLIPKR